MAKNFLFASQRYTDSKTLVFLEKYELMFIDCVTKYGQSVYIFEMMPLIDERFYYPKEIRICGDLYIRHFNKHYFSNNQVEDSTYMSIVFDWLANDYCTEIDAALHEAIYKKVYDLIQPSRKKTVLDFGCGTGIGGNALVQHKYRPFISLYGCDVSEKMLDKISVNIKSCYEEIALTSTALLPYRTAQFDCIMFVFVIHLLQGEVVDEIFRVLGPEGEIIFNLFKFEQYKERYVRIFSNHNILSVQKKSYNLVSDNTVEIVRLKKK